MKALFPLLLACLAFCACDQEKVAAGPELGASPYSMSDRDKKLVAEKFPGVTASPTGVISIIRKPGEGTATPRHGALVIMNYELRLLDGTFVESTQKQGEPFKVNIGVGRVIKGWDEAVMQMHKGERRTIVLPHYLAYGVTGSPPQIPPYATLVFELELIDFK
jgi:FKBP-type peptidyl-prolyl cis-trans isomerase